MNKISLISLALSFLFTLTSGCVHSNDGEENNNGSATTEQTANNDITSGVNTDNSEEKTKTTKKKKRSKSKRKRSKSVVHYSSANSEKNKFTEKLNKQSLSEAQSTEATK